MRITGTTFEAYLPVDAARLARLRVMGLTAQRAIAHNGGIYRMEGKTWPQESGYLDVVLDLYRVHGFKTLYDTMNHDALPWWSPTGDWKSANTKFDEATFRAWLADYIAYMTPSGLDYRLVWGNEPDADGSPYLKDEAAFRNRYRMVAETVAKAKWPMMLGAGGWCQDWARAAAFVVWAESQGLRLDFIDLHIYRDPSQLLKAVAAIRAVSGVPIVILESGADWMPGRAVSATGQRRWFAEMSRACDASGISAWHLHHSGGTADVEPMALTGAGGRLTPIGAMVTA